MGSRYSRYLLAVFIIAVFVLIAIAVVSLSLNVKIPHLTRDVTAIAGLHPFTGVLSNLGIILWCVTATVCLFSAFLPDQNAKGREEKSFLMMSSFLTAYLLFDDLFQFHETIANKLFGIGENIVYLAIAAAVLAYVIRYAKIILHTQYIPLVCSVCFLGASVVIDSMIEPFLSSDKNWVFLWEDGAKWLGITLWCSYFVHTSYCFVAYKPNQQ